MATTVRQPILPTAKAVKAPAINLILRQGETIDDILRSSFSITRFSQEKANHLYSYVATLPNVAGKVELTNYLAQLSQRGRDPTEDELNQLVILESDFEVNLRSSPPPNDMDETSWSKMIAGMAALYPVTAVTPPFLEDQAKELADYLQTIQPAPAEVTEVLDFIAEPPTNMGDSLRFRQALLRLRNNAANYGIDIDFFNRNLPIALVGPAEINVLKTMTYPDKTPVFDMINRHRLNEAIGVILQLGYVQGVDFIKQAQSSMDLVFNLPVATIKRAQDNYNLHIKLLKTKPEVRSESVYPCLKCQSKNVISSEKQTRSADEPMTIFFTCLNCGNRWVIR